MTYGNFPLLLDGATGTALMRAGLTDGESPERWILSCREHEDLIVRVQKEYIQSGSAALYTPTFGANRAVLGRFSLEDKVEEYNLRLASLSLRAKEESGAPVLIGGNLSPTGYFLRPYGDQTFARIAEIYREQAAALHRAGVDFFIVETCLSLSEARAALYAIRSVCDKPVWVTFSLDESGRTLSGNTVEACAVSLCAAGVSGFGLNCSRGPDDMLEPLRNALRFLPETVALIAKPNAGIPAEKDGEIKTIPPDEYARGCGRLLEIGVDAIGGCCGTDGAYLRALRDALPLYRRGERAREGEWEALYTNGREVFPLRYDGSAPVFPCDGALCDRVCEAEGDYLHLRLEDAGGLDDFLDAAPYFDRPVVLSSRDGSLLRQAEAVYEGKLKSILTD